MKKVKCFAKDCNKIIKIPKNKKIGFCSYECAIYAGYFSVNKGWIKRDGIFNDK